MKKIVALTGAGISKASGIPTYEDKPHLKSAFQLSTFIQTPELFWDGYLELTATLKDTKPNDAHNVLSEYEIPVVTQNIDSLHQKSGSKDVIELHGSTNKASCVDCGAIVYDTANGKCSCGGWLKPNVVLYGEEVTQFPYALARIMNADVLLVIGTALQVATTSNLVEFAFNNDIQIIEINSEAETKTREIIERIIGE